MESQGSSAFLYIPKSTAHQPMAPAHTLNNLSVCGSSGLDLTSMNIKVLLKTININDMLI